MEALQTILLVVQVMVAISLIGFILIQHGKGADAGAGFGSGASGTVFGSRGSGNFMTKTTSVLATMFLANSLALGYLATQREKPTSLMEQAARSAAEEQVIQETKVDLPTDLPVTEPDSDLPELPTE